MINIIEYRIGVCSSHGTGKTTLVNDLASALQIPVLRSDLKKYWEEWGVTDFTRLPSQVRSVFQFLLLERFSNDRAEQIKINNSFVADRTPFDFWGYTQVESDMSVEQKESFRQHIMTSLLIHNFSHIVFIPPEFDMVNETNRGSIYTQKAVADATKDLLFRTFPVDQIVIVSGNPEVRVNQVLQFLDI